MVEFQPIATPAFDALASVSSPNLMSHCLSDCLTNDFAATFSNDRIDSFLNLDPGTKGLKALLDPDDQTLRLAFQDGSRTDVLHVVNIILCNRLL